MKRGVILIAVLSALIFISFADGKTKTPSWASWNQRANTQIALGGVYSRRHGAASPQLKYIITQMIYMKFGHGYDGKKMWCYANRESGLNPGALSSTGDHNIFQLNYAAHHNTFDFVRLDKPEVGYGIISGWRLRQGAGYQPWVGGTYSCPQGNEP